MTFTTETHWCGFNLFSSYGGYGDPEYILNEESLDEYFENDCGIPKSYYFEYFDWSLYKVDLYKNIFNCLELLFDNINIETGLDFKLSFVEGYSPREYNFRGDGVFFTCKVDKEKVLAYIEEHKEEFSKFLKRYDINPMWRCHTVYTAHVYNDWLECFLNEEEDEVNAMMYYFVDKFLDEDNYYYIDQFQQGFDSAENYCNMTHFHEFMTDLEEGWEFISFDKDWKKDVFRIKHKDFIEKVVQERYGNCSFDELINIICNIVTNEYTYSELKNLIEKSAYNAKKQIENHTLNLFNNENQN